MSPLTPWAIGKLSRADNREKGMPVMFEGAGTVMCHNFDYQLKLTGTVTWMSLKDTGIILEGGIERFYTVIGCIIRYLVYMWRKWMGSNQMPHATIVYGSWFLSGVWKDEVDIQRKWGWRQEQAAPATGQGGWDREDTRSPDSLVCCSWSKWLELWRILMEMGIRSNQPTDLHLSFGTSSWTNLTIRRFG